MKPQQHLNQARIPKKEEILSCFPKDHTDDEALEFYWRMLPPEAREFIRSTSGNLSLAKLVEFWGQYHPSMDRSVMKNVYDASWYLALHYVVRNELAMARSLTLNGCFLEECYHASFEKVSALCCVWSRVPSTHHKNIFEAQLPYFFAGMVAIHSGHDALYSFLMRVLSPKYKQIIAEFFRMEKQNHVVNDLICSLYAPKKKSIQEGSITLMIGGESFEACPSKPLKTVFNEYADKHSVSLKTLRFSYAGKTLFLSTVGNKSPNELDMIDHDSIEVHPVEVISPTPTNDTLKFQETNNSVTQKQKKKAKGKSNKRKKGTYRLKVEKSDEEYKQDHSFKLTKLHEEAAPKFKEIRQQLDALLLFKQQPKTKVHSKSLSNQAYSYAKFNPMPEGLGGKAGKTHFVLNVGEVSNLYKSSKSNHHVSSTTSTLDLHGCSQAEAISKLNAGLENWNNQAMTGSYPFIRTVSIICGAGGQVLSEVVEKWVKEKPNVCNAPKMKMTRCKFPSVA